MVLRSRASLRCSVVSSPLRLVMRACTPELSSTTIVRSWPTTSVVASSNRVMVCCRCSRARSLSPEVTSSEILLLVLDHGGGELLCAGEQVTDLQTSVSQDRRQVLHVGQHLRDQRRVSSS